MPSDPHSTTLSQTAWTFWFVAIIVVLGFFRFGSWLSKEPSFADEWAYVSQTYYGPLWWTGDWNHPAWIEYPAIDLPPIPKYLHAFMLKVGGYSLSDREQALRWYNNINTNFGDQAKLWYVRIPSVFFGVVGCVALLGIGTLAFGRRTGLLAAVLLMTMPLYVTHARRAMSDVITESLTLVSLAIGLWSWRLILQGGRPILASIGLIFGAGFFAGLAVLAKLSGGIAIMVAAGWGLLGILVASTNAQRGLLLGATIGFCFVAYATFVTGNPTILAQPDLPPNASGPLQRLVEAGPIERTFAVLEHRAKVSRAGQADPRFRAQNYPLTDLPAKLSVVLVQGYGRFGPLGPSSPDSEVRFQWKQDWGGLVWLPLVLSGLVYATFVGLRQREEGKPPVALALGVHFLIVFGTVTTFIPLAWDRYMLPIGPISTLLASASIVGVIQWTCRRFGIRSGG